MTKHARAVEYIEAGVPNLQIIIKLTEEFGRGISTNRLAEIRASLRSKVIAADVMADKRALCREMLITGHSGYAIKKECRSRFGAGLGQETINAIRAKLDADMAGGPGLIEKVDLPPEMLEPETVHTIPDPPSALILTPPPGPNGTLDNIKVIQRWMVSINAESLSLTQGGTLSVLARHNFDIGGIE